MVEVAGFEPAAFWSRTKYLLAQVAHSTKRRSFFYNMRFVPDIIYFL